MKTKPMLVAIAVGNYLEIFSPDEIIRIESDDDSCTIHITSGRKIVTYTSLALCAERLRRFHFNRPHNSHLVNMNHVRKVQVTQGGCIVLSNGAQVPIARRRKESFYGNFVVL